MSLSDNEALFLKDKKIILAWNITIALFEGHISHCHCFLFLRYFIERVTVVLVSFLYFRQMKCKRRFLKSEKYNPNVS